MMLARSPLIQPGQVRPTNPINFVIPNGLVGYWGLDPDCLDFTNNLALDLSGQGNNGTLTNLPASTLANGQVGTALNLSATGFVAVANSPTINFGVGDWSICGWFSTSLNNLYICSHQKATSAFNGYGIYVQSQIKVETSDGILATTVGTLTVNDGARRFFTVTRHGSAILIYINAALDKSGTGRAGDLSQTVGLKIGSFSDGTQPWQSFLDDIRIYNRALDPSEIIHLYRAGLAGRR